MSNKTSQKEKAELFHQLHHSGEMLVFPNIWDSLGAALMQDLGYQAIATASAAIAYSNGYDDGENIPFADLLPLLKRITGAVNIPVTADIETGYANNTDELKKNIELLLETGIVGINFEDSDKTTNKLFPIEYQCEKIRSIKAAGAAQHIPIFINARTDVYVKGNDFWDEAAKLDETIKRGKAYLEAGADCIFPILVDRRSSIQTLISTLNCPINIIALGAVPPLKVLSEMGIARVSVGPGFLKATVRTMKDLAGKLKNYEGLEDITGNEITSTYLKELVKRT